MRVIWKDKINVIDTRSEIPNFSRFYLHNYCSYNKMSNDFFYVKTSLARLFNEKCPQNQLRPVIGTRSVIGPGPIKSRSVIGTRPVIGPFALCNALSILSSGQYTLINWYVGRN